MRRVIVLGGGFGGVASAQHLSKDRSVEVLIISRTDFQTYTPEQRALGTLIGAVVAAVFLLAVSSKHVLVAVIVIFFAAMAWLFKVNYALFCFGLAVAVLIALDLPNPTNLSDEGRRVLYTFAGVALAVIVTFLLDRLKKRSAKAAPAAS